MFGLVVLGLGFTAFVANRRAVKTAASQSPIWRRAHRWRWLLMLVLGVAAVFVVYPVAGGAGQHYKVWGFPFMAAAFDSRGADYVSPLTPVLMVFDILVWAVLPDLFLWGWHVYAGRRNSGTGV